MNIHVLQMNVLILAASITDIFRLLFDLKRLFSIKLQKRLQQCLGIVEQW